MRLKITALIIVMTLAPTVQAQTITSESIDTLMRLIQYKYSLPALAGAIVTPDGIAAIGVAGERATGTGDAAEKDDQWHIGSCTKAMTATVIARLVDRGKLSWETTLGEIYEPENVHPELQQVTVRQLLGHRGGFDRGWNNALSPDPGESPRVQRAQLVEKVLKLKPNFQPGRDYHYSNVGYIIAGHITEKVMNKPWETVIKDALFRPLRMRETGFGAPGKFTRKGVNTFTDPVGHAPGGTANPGFDNPAFIGPAGTVHCTLQDWGLFIAEHIKGSRGQSRLISKAQFDQLHEPLPGPGDVYSLGWGVSTSPSGGTSLRHNGSNTQWYSMVMVDLEGGYGVMVATNIGNGTGEGEAKASQACQEAVRALTIWYRDQLAKGKFTTVKEH
ncbi:MAG: penicillin-binding protein [Phycisphaerae bacterium]|nr:penicillin-binding protein [Phycisphaerae bacterium]